ncbi:15507_t:CDS:2, partial [Dentiscutata erythropus]
MAHIEIPMSTEKPNLIKESDLFTKYAGVSLDESFIAILDTNNDDKFELRMYNVITNEDTNKKELSKEHSQSLTFFTDEENEIQEQQIILMRSSRFSNWSISITNENKEKKYRLIAISCISDDDMQNLPYEDVAGLGIYKHRLSYSSASDELQDDVKMFDFPERIEDALKYNYSDYIIDTSGRDPNKNIELYNLKTNQLINVFKRFKFVLSILDREKPGAFAVSSDEKLLA